MSSAVDSFALILTPINPLLELDVEIVDDIYMSKATDAEIEMIRPNAPTPSNLYARALYEADIYVPSTGGLGFAYIKKPNWKYFVLRFRFDDQLWHDFVKILCIAKKDLHIGPGFMYPNPPNFPGPEFGRFGYSVPICENYWGYLMRSSKLPVVTINEADINEYHDLYCLYKKQIEEFPWLKYTLNMFYDLNGVPTHHRLYSLGLFTVLEALITHAPGERETGDSVSRQLSTKMPLLEQRIDISLDQTTFGNAMTSKNLWSKLYKFRSKLAHGGNLDFASGDLAALKSSDAANEFLRILLKALIRGALKEPRLYQDLKEC